MARYSYYNRSSYSNMFDNLPAPPLYLVFFIFILFYVLGLSWYIMLSSVLLLLLVHLFSAPGSEPERDSVQRAGGSPWGVALLLVVLLFMISYQPSFQERWFPIYKRYR